jgi:hypothetical protein
MAAVHSPPASAAGALVDGGITVAVALGPPVVADADGGEDMPVEVETDVEAGVWPEA